MKKIFVILLLVISSSLFTFCNAQYTQLLDFNGRNGSTPGGSLTQIGGKLYGMTFWGVAGWGGIFSIDTNGSGYKNVYFFIGPTTNGAYPNSSLSYSGGVFYGMTEYGGANNDGCIFSIDTDGSKYKELHDFDSTFGASPKGSLTLSANKLYGMTCYGGANDEGCIFSIDTNGTEFKDILDFNGSNGLEPWGSLAISGKMLYGVTQEGGATYHAGNIFTLDTDGSGYRDLFDFNGTNGELPLGSLTLAGNTMYGMTNIGGANNLGCLFSIDTGGTGFKDLLDFNGTNGENPEGSLLLSDGKLYGTTEKGGAFIYLGTVFSIGTDGSGYTDVFDFNGSDGENPVSDLILNNNVLYGMTPSGGEYFEGVVFSFKDNAIRTSTTDILSYKKAVNLYPNPNNGIFTIVLSHPPAGGSQPTIEIYNALGQQVYSAPTLLPQSGGGVSFSCKIDLSAEPNGVYLYRIIANNGGLIGEGKVIIQK